MEITIDASDLIFQKWDSALNPYNLRLADYQLLYY